MRAASLFPLLLLLLTRPLAAHPPGITVATLLVEPEASRLELSVKAADLERATGLALTDASGRTDPDRLEAASGAIAAHLRDKIGLRDRSGLPCGAELEELVAADDGVLAVLAFDCGAEDGPLTYASRLLADVAPQTVQHLMALVGEDALPYTVAPDDPGVRLETGSASVAAVFAGYLRAGIEHILAGWDHLAFLAALLLWADRVRPVVLVVTAFTLSHSLTLSLAALGIVDVPARIVEPAIAATVVWVAVENFLSRDVARRWRIAFALGLVHGFGFAGLLREMGLPQDQLLVSLAAFNLGVEFGQLAVVALFVPLLLLADRLRPGPETGGRRSPALVHAASAAIGLAGLVWLGERLLAAPTG